MTKRMLLIRFKKSNYSRLDLKSALTKHYFNKFNDMDLED